MTESHFKTTLSGQETGPAGMVVPPECVAALGTSKKPAVLVTVNGYSYESTVAVMGGVFMIGFAAEHRRATGLKAGDPIDVTLTLLTAPRVVEVPPDMGLAMANAGLRVAFDAAAPSRRKEMVRLVTDAKTPETRERRIQKVLSDLGS